MLVWSEWAFLTSLLFFHLSEAGLAWTYMRHEFGRSSFLVSRPYVLAMSVGLLEHWLWARFHWPLKQQSLVAVLGLVVVVIGEAVRKAGMITAKSAFTHKIQMERRPEHRLITHGIYKYVRHPGYLGWAMWAVGMQLLLVNPVCTVLFSLWVWKFFQQRIAFEESMLVSFFGAQYEEYKATTRTWIPGIP